VLTVIEWGPNKKKEKTFFLKVGSYLISVSLTPLVNLELRISLQNGAYGIFRSRRETLIHEKPQVKTS
jgi:hypothetical protein